MTEPSEPEDYTLSVGGVRLACHRWGPGGAALGKVPVLVFVHGAGVDSSFFAEPARLLARVRTVVSYDRRGHGDSSDPIDGDWSAGAQARDLAAVCEQVAGGAPVAVVAHSLGAGVALRMAVARPDLVATLILDEPFGAGETPSAESQCTRREIARLAAGGRMARAMLLALSLQGEPDPRPRPLSAQEEAHLDRNMAVMVSHELAGHAEPLDLDAIRVSLGGTPVFVGLGELSRGADAGRAAPRLAEALGCPLVARPGAHNGPRDLPLEFSALVEGLLRLAS